jgi:hypothetical protein
MQSRAGRWLTLGVLAAAIVPACGKNLELDFVDGGMGGGPAGAGGSLGGMSGGGLAGRGGMAGSAAGQSGTAGVGASSGTGGGPEIVDAAAPLDAGDAGDDASN